MLPSPSGASCWPPRTTSGDQPHRSLLGPTSDRCLEANRHNVVLFVIQSDPYKAGQTRTVLTAVVASNTALAAMTGNVFLTAVTTGLPRDSVVNGAALATLTKTGSRGTCRQSAGEFDG